MLADYTNLPYAVAVNPGVLTYALPSGMKVYDEADLDLVLEEADGTVGFEPVLGTHYTVAIAKNYSASITFLANTELVSGRKLVVDRWTDASQPSRFSNLNYFPGETTELQHDRAVAMVQDLRARATRSLLARRGDTLPELPAWSTLWGNIFYPNADGSGWSIISADDFKALAEDLGLGALGVVSQVSAMLAEIEQLADIDAELVALAALAPDLVANLANIVAVATALSAGDIDRLLSELSGRSVVTASSYKLRVGIDYTDIIDAMQAVLDDCSDYGVHAGAAIAYDIDDDLEGSVYFRQGNVFVPAGGTMKINADAGWLEKGTSAHNGIAGILTACANGDTTYPEDSLRVRGFLNVELTLSHDTSVFEACRLVGLRDSDLVLSVKVVSDYATTTASGAQTAGASTLNVASIDKVLIGHKIQAGAKAYFVRSDWDGVSTQLPLRFEDGTSATLLEDVADGETIYIGGQGTPLNVYRDNRDSKITIFFEQDACYGACWVGEFSLAGQSYVTENLEVNVFGHQKGPARDELAALFTGKTASGPIRNVHMNVRGNARSRLWGAMNHCDLPDRDMSCSAYVEGYVREPVSGGSVMHARNTSVQVKCGTVFMGVPASADATYPCWGFRVHNMDGNRPLPKIEGLRLVQVGDPTGKTPIEGITGPARWENIKTETADGGQFKWSAKDVDEGEIIGGDFCSGSSGCIGNARRVTHATARGLLSNVDHFSGGPAIIDPSAHGGIIFAHTDASTRPVFRPCEIVLTGTDALTRVVDAAGCASFEVDYTLHLAAGGASPGADLLPAAGDGRRVVVDSAGAIVSAAYNFSDAAAFRNALNLEQQHGLITDAVFYFGTVDGTAGAADLTTTTIEYFQQGLFAELRFNFQFGPLGANGMTGILGFQGPAGFAPLDSNEGAAGAAYIENAVGLRSQVGVRTTTGGTPRFIFTQIKADGTGTEDLTEANVGANMKLIGSVNFNLAG